MRILHYNGHERILSGLNGLIGERFPIRRKMLAGSVCSEHFPAGQKSKKPARIMKSRQVFASE